MDAKSEGICQIPRKKIINIDAEIMHFCVKCSLDYKNASSQ